MGPMALGAGLVIAIRTAALALSVRCEAELPARVGEPLVWIAHVEGTSGGELSYSWEYSPNTRDDWRAIPGASSPVVHQFLDVGAWKARVTVTDLGSGVTGRSEACAMHVIPRSFKEPPEARLVVWLPRDVNLPLSAENELRRVWRWARTAIFHAYGRTFRDGGFAIVRSTATEEEICGGDCDTLQGIEQAAGGKERYLDRLRGHAAAEIERQLPNFASVEYRREVLRLIWGAAGVAGNSGWDVPVGDIGDWAIAPVAGLQTPSLRPNLYLEDRSFLTDGVLGYYRRGRFTVAHELNHGIGWDGPNDFDPERGNVDERQLRIVRRSPWLYESLGDVVRPSVSIVSPGQGDVVSGTLRVEVQAEDDERIDAVVLLVDGIYKGTATSSPYVFFLDTTMLSFGLHVITAIAYDREGNDARVEREIVVKNTIGEPSGECSESFPSGYFEVCFYDGIGQGGPYLGGLRDAPFSQPAPNGGYLMKHFWRAGEEVAFGESETFTVVWRGTLDFPADMYVFTASTSGVARVWIDGELLFQLDNQERNVFVDLAPGTRVEIEWFHWTGPPHLWIYWWPTSIAPASRPPSSPEVQGLAGGPEYFVETDPGQLLELELRSVDPDGDLVSLSASQEVTRGPLEEVGASLEDHGDGTGTFRWIPSPEQGGLTFTFLLIARDSNGYAASSRLVVRVRQLPEPVFESPVVTVKVREGEQVRALTRAKDPQGQPVTYFVSGLPAGALFTHFGDANLDGALTAGDLVALTRLAAAGLPVETAEGIVGDLDRDGQFGETDLDLLSAALFQAPTEILSWIPTFTQSGVYNVEVTAVDPDGFSSTQQISISVENVPNFFRIGNRWANVGAPLGFPVEAADDQEGPVRYAMVNAPSGAVLAPLGDSDFDGVLTVADLQRAVLFAQGGATPAAIQVAVCDADGDGRITDVDVDAITAAFLVPEEQQPRQFAWAPDVPGEWLVLFAAVNRAGVPSFQFVTLVAPEVPTQNLVGHVASAEGAPLARTLVRLRGRAADGTPIRAEAMTGVEGAYTIAAIPAGTYVLRPWRPRWVFEPRRVMAAVPEEDRPVQFTGEPRRATGLPAAGSATVRGTVSDAYGRPIAGARLTLSGTTRDGERVRVRTMSGPHGAFIVDNLPEGYYRLVAWVRGVRLTRRFVFFDLHDGEVREVNFRERVG
ncbi:MAG: hypothetical protein KatS3mg115_2684 [Candidatus Poribacteria bacterium]|nr:MAG: hypothetical protein KatS3mg115_2684 [Candidatus Poribacteria bacterium]